MNFGKFEKDILDAFEELVKPVDKLTLEEKAFYSLDLNATLNKILNSYYFEKLYDSELIRERIDGNSICYLRLPDKDRYLGNVYFRNAGIFHDALNNPETGFGIKLSGRGMTVSNFKMSNLYADILEKLEQKDPIYKKIFETSPIRQSLFLKERHSIQYSVIYPENEGADQSIYKEILKFHKLGYVNEKESCALLKSEQLQDAMVQYDLMHFGIGALNKQNFMVIAHNDHEICGVAGVSDSEATGLLFMSYISVARSFRGQKIGIHLFNNVKNELEKNAQIMEMSQYTTAGRKYLSEPLETIIKTTSNIISTKEMETMAPLFRMINQKHLESDDRFDIIKTVHHKIRHENLDIKELSFAQINSLAANKQVDAQSIDNNQKEVLGFKPILKKAFARLF